MQNHRKAVAGHPVPTLLVMTYREGQVSAEAEAPKERARKSGCQCRLLLSAFSHISQEDNVRQEWVGLQAEKGTERAQEGEGSVKRAPASNPQITREVSNGFEGT